MIAPSTVAIPRCSLLALLLIPLAAGDGEEPPMSGYSPAHARDERQIEQNFRRIPSPDEEKKQHRFFTAEKPLAPRLAGCYSHCPAMPSTNKTKRAAERIDQDSRRHIHSRSSP